MYLFGQSKNTTCRTSVPWKNSRNHKKRHFLSAQKPTHQTCLLSWSWLHKGTVEPNNTFIKCSKQHNTSLTDSSIFLLQLLHLSHHQYNLAGQETSGNIFFYWGTKASAELRTQHTGSCVMQYSIASWPCDALLFLKLIVALEGRRETAWGGGMKWSERSRMKLREGEGGRREGSHFSLLPLSIPCAANPRQWSYSSGPGCSSQGSQTHSISVFLPGLPLCLPKLKLIPPAQGLSIRSTCEITNDIKHGCQSCFTVGEWRLLEFHSFLAT